MNTKFFHAITKHGRARNKITDLLDSSCNLVEEKEELVVIATSYFRSLYEASNLELRDEALPNVTTTISGRLNADLTTLVTKWEVKLTLFTIYPEKSLGPDDLTALFDKKL